jgi:hypothetical protein
MPYDPNELTPEEKKVLKNYREKKGDKPLSGMEGLILIVVALLICIFII